MRASTLLFLFLCGTLLSGCVNHIAEEEEERQQEKREKTIVFKTQVNVTQTPMRSVGDNVSTIIVADYQGGAEIQQIKQLSTDAHFGKISMPLKYGTHELLFVAHNAESEVFSYPSISFDKPMDTFSFYKEIVVDENTDETQSIELPRAAALIKVTATDAIPLGVLTLKITLSAYYPSLNVKTASASGSPVSVERSFEYKTAHVGVKGSTYSIYSFAPEGGFTTTVTIATLDSDGKTLNSITANSVSIDKNCQTKISGNLFQSTLGADLTVNTEWKDDIIVPIP